MADTVLHVEDLTVGFPTRDGASRGDEGADLPAIAPQTTAVHRHGRLCEPAHIPPPSPLNLRGFHE